MRAKVIEGNLSLLYRTRQLCSPGEWLAVRLLRGFILHDLDDTCSDAALGLGGKPDALWIEARPQPGGEVILQARLPDRDRSFPLLSPSQRRTPVSMAPPLSSWHRSGLPCSSGSCGLRAESSRQPRSGGDGSGLL